MNDTTQTQTATESKTPRESENWTRMENELAEWGRKLDELRLKADKVGQEVVNDLQRRYDVVKSETEALKQSTERELEQVRDQAEKLTTEAEMQSQSTIEAARERTEEMKQGAQDVSEGFAKAWSELRNGFEQAYKRLN